MTTVDAIHPIEAESYRILESRVDLRAFGPRGEAVVARVIHASADLEYAQSMVVDEVAAEAGIAALRRNAPVVCDVEMVRHGITGPDTRCYLGDVASADVDDSDTRSAAAMRMAAAHHRTGAIFVVGCAPTALAEVVRLASEGELAPALVVGLPVGFVGAAEAKQALRDSGVLAISNVGEKGGSAVAAAVVNALLRLAKAESPGGVDGDA